MRRTVYNCTFNFFARKQTQCSCFFHLLSHYRLSSVRAAILTIPTGSSSPSHYCFYPFFIPYTHVPAPTAPCRHLLSLLQQLLPELAIPPRCANGCQHPFCAGPLASPLQQPHHASAAGACALAGTFHAICHGVPFSYSKFVIALPKF